MAAGDLSELVERFDSKNWLDERSVAFYVKHLLVATAHSHSARIYHRDLKVGACVAVRLISYGIGACLTYRGLIYGIGACLTG